MPTGFVRYTPEIETIDPDLDRLLEQIIAFWEKTVRESPHLCKFQQELIKIEDEINERNKTRTPYEFLLPSKIPQSINI